MKKRRSGPKQPRKRKYVRAEAENDLVLKAKARKLKAAIQDLVIDLYLSDTLIEYDIPVITMTELMEQSGLVKEEALSELYRKYCHRYLKAALGEAIKQGIPGVMVTAKFCNEVEAEQYETEVEEKELQSWVAGLGRASKAEGILYVYEDDETACLMERMQTGHQISVTNGNIIRSRNHVEAAVQAQLPGYDGRARLVKSIRGLPSSLDGDLK